MWVGSRRRGPVTGRRSGDAGTGWPDSGTDAAMAPDAALPGAMTDAMPRIGRLWDLPPSHGERFRTRFEQLANLRVVA